MGIKLFKVRAKDIAYLCGAFLLFSSCVGGAKECATEENPVVYADTINFHFATIEEGRTLITTEDNYARNLSKFDIIARLQNPQGTEVELTDLSVRSLREWTEEEKEKIKIMMYAINDSIRKNNFRLPLPPTITLVKSTLEEEGGAAGYTRSNWIALTDRLFTHLPESFHTTLLLHELFHVLTRNSIEFKREMYATIGFTVENQELKYPQDLLNLRISNPDIDKYDSYATFMVDGEAQKCAMILYADKPYTSGNFFEYMTVLAFAAFADAKVDAAVVEVGLGGRLDSTNIVHPDICAITSIGLDHTSILGDTYAQIAAEKAGIIKESVPVLSVCIRKG